MSADQRKPRKRVPKGRRNGVPPSPITPAQTDRTLAAYALNLLHGAELQDFERENLLALAKDAGADVTAAHHALQAQRQAREEAIDAKLQDRADLRDTLIRCRDQFRQYEHLHQLKPEGAGKDKAKINGDMATMCDAALTRTAR